MAQAFVTTYQKYHRWHKIDKRKSLRPVDKLAETLPEGDIWIIPKKIGEDDGEGGHSLAAAEAAVHRMNRRRLWSTYLVDYCPELVAKEEAKPAAPPPGNAILLYGEALYGPRTQKIPPPLPTARRLYGYIRPSRMYYPITTYENIHGRVGYQILLANSELKPNSSSIEQLNIPIEETEDEKATPKFPQKESEQSKATPQLKEMKFEMKPGELSGDNRIKPFDPRRTCPCK